MGWARSVGAGRLRPSLCARDGVGGTAPRSPAGGGARAAARSGNYFFPGRRRDTGRGQPATRCAQVRPGAGPRRLVHIHADEAPPSPRPRPRIGRSAVPAPGERPRRAPAPRRRGGGGAGPALRVPRPRRLALYVNRGGSAPPAAPEVSRKEAAAQRPVGPRRSERSRKRALGDTEASAGGRPGVPGEARARAHLAGPAPSGRPPLGASRLGRAGTPGFPGGAGRGGLRPGPPASPRVPSLRRSGRKPPAESATGNRSLPGAPAITEFGFRVCTIVLALGSGQTGAPPGRVRGSPRAESPRLDPHVQGVWPRRPATRVSGGLSPRAAAAA